MARVRTCGLSSALTPSKNGLDLREGGTLVNYNALLLVLDFLLYSTVHVKQFQVKKNLPSLS